jgi:hypothetical protein
MNHRRTSVLAFALALAALLAGACVSPHHAQQVSDAQSALSAGAALETQAKFSSSEVPLGIEALVHSSTAFYHEAERLIAGVVADDKAALQADSLYGTALTVRAVALWRLGRLDEAEDVAQEVVAVAESARDTRSADGAPNQVYPRDEALCRALPTLIRIDALGRLVGKIVRSEETESREQLEGILAGGVECAEALKEVRDLPEMAGHPLLMYLAQCECEVALVMYRALGSVQSSVKTPAHVKQVADVREKALKALTAEAGEESELYAHYAGLLSALQPNP